MYIIFSVLNALGIFLLIAKSDLGLRGRSYAL